MDRAVAAQLDHSAPRKLTLRRDLARHLRSGHPWLYRDALEIPQGVPMSSVVDIMTRDGRFLGRGLYDADSPLAVRIYTLDRRQSIDAALVRARLEAAWQLRIDHLDLTRTNAFRWSNGEGDFLPGVVIDRYDAIAVLRLDGVAVGALREAIVAAVAELAPARGIRTLIERARGEQWKALWGDAAPDVVTIRENDAQFAVDVQRGQKTGFFLDQRDNRALVGALGAGRRVANLFSYTGGFSLYAARAGATRVDSVDVAPEAIAGARRNFVLNGLDPEVHGFFAEDVFAWLDRSRTEARYGLVIVDPPSFAPSEESLERALSAYRDVFARGVALVETGGYFCPASCSSHVTMAQFSTVVREAASQAKRRLQLVIERSQPADHPSPLPFGEGRYLKFAILRVLD